jgi:hypothetical protein
MEEIKVRLFEIYKWISENKNRREFSSNNEYMDFAFEIANRARYLVLVSASLTNDDLVNGMTRNRAAITGLMVRIFKLFDSLSMNVAKSRGEISAIFTRMIFETHVTMRYLIVNGDSSIDSFVKSSYKASIENYLDLKTKSEQRELTQIEKRIKTKIERKVSSDGFTIEELLENRNWKLDGKSMKQILSDIGMNIEYHFVFGNMSSLVHGTWQDVKLNHLTEDNGLYFPKVEFDAVDPRYLNPMTIQSLVAAIEYLEWSNLDPDKLILEACQQLCDLTKEFDGIHEATEFENRE